MFDRLCLELAISTKLGDELLRDGLFKGIVIGGLARGNNVHLGGAAGDDLHL